LYGNVIGYRNLAEVHADCEFLLVENRKDQNEITLFPNPARNRISITTPDEVTIDDAIIYSQTGQKVFQGKPINRALDNSKLPPGMYLVEMVTGQWKVRMKLIVE